MHNRPAQTEQPGHPGTLMDRIEVAGNRRILAPGRFGQRDMYFTTRQWQCLWLASLAFWLGSVVVWVITIIKAFSNVEWEIPYLGKLARKQLATQTLV